MCLQKVLSFEKKFLPPGFKPATSSQLLYPLNYMAVVFSGMLLDFSVLLRLQPATEPNLITALTCVDKVEVGR